MYKEPYMQNLISKRNFGLTKWLYICIKNLICKILYLKETLALQNGYIYV